VFLSACSAPVSLFGFFKDVEECEARISQAASMIDYTKYLRITIQPIKFDEITNPDTGLKDATFRGIIYKLRFENISNKELKFGTIVFKSKKISDISLNPDPLEDSSRNPVVLKPGQGYNCNVEAQILKNNPLSETQIDALLREYYFEVSIDGKMAYFKLDGPENK
jgi:hypothetical protein